MSTQTFMHTGYTGTCVCIDPVNNLWSVILTNRYSTVYIRVVIYPFILYIYTGHIIVGVSYAQLGVVTQ